MRKSIAAAAVIAACAATSACGHGEKDPGQTVSRNSSATGKARKFSDTFGHEACE